MLTNPLLKSNALISVRSTGASDVIYSCFTTALRVPSILTNPKIVDTSQISFDKFVGLITLAPLK